MGPGLRALHTAALGSFALSQPLLDLIGKHPEFLVAHGLEGAPLWVLAAALGLALPAGLAALAWALGRLVGRHATPLHRGVVALLCAGIALPLLGRAGALPAAAAAAGALALGAGAGAAYARSRLVQRFASALSPAPLLFPLHFLLWSPAAPLLSTGSAPGAAASSSAPTAGALPVVVLVFDAFPLPTLLDLSHRMDRARFPNFAALADQAHWFRNTSAVSTRTGYALPALLAGRYPDRHALATARQYPQNLFTLLAGSHAFNAIEPLTLLCPEGLCNAVRAGEGRSRLASLAADLAVLAGHASLPPAWAAALPDVTHGWRGFGGREPARRPRESATDPRFAFDRFLAGLRADARPGFHFLHLLLPHYPFKYLPSGREYRPDAGGAPDDGDASHPDPRWAEIQALQRLLLQVGYADALVGRLVEALRREALYDDSLLVVTADHGIRPPGRVQADRPPAGLGDALLVPLLIKLPGQRHGTVSDRNVETVDLLPTLADVLGIQLAGPVDGHSLLDPNAPERPDKRFYVHPDGSTDPPRLRRIPPAVPAGLRSVRRIFELFELGEGGTDVYRVGPHRELLGRPIVDLARATAPPLPLRLADAGDYERVDLESDFLPAHVMGELELDVPAGFVAEVAVAVNGRIRATTRGYPAPGGTRFAALVPESSFRAGRNELEVFLVQPTTPGGGIELRATRRH